MPERGPNDWSGRRSEISGFHQPGFVSHAASLDAGTERARHHDRIGGFRNRGVEQHRVIAEFERLRRMRRRAEPRRARARTRL